MEKQREIWRNREKYGETEKGRVKERNSEMQRKREK